jgi:hypothetical protein
MNPGEIGGYHTECTCLAALAQPGVNGVIDADHQRDIRKYCCGGSYPQGTKYGTSRSFAACNKILGIVLKHFQSLLPSPKM